MSTVRSCKIQGYDSGVCVVADKAYRISNMPFCASHTNYELCLPEEKYIPPDRNFPNGRWNNFTVRAKDDYIRRMITGNIHWRIDLETKWRLQEENPLCKKPPCNEWGEHKEIIPPFFRVHSATTRTKRTRVGSIFRGATGLATHFPCVRRLVTTSSNIVVTRMIYGVATCRSSAFMISRSHR
mmetsp:Transcript_88091/g.251419  ORF Transcript_88091/g.251419 Transcript_88091/m.251419 type:complete len:183 (+) Transcript_88091:599-1147(+)